MIKKQLFFSLIFLFIWKGTLAQYGFKFANSSKVKETVSFQLINNLIIIPIEINGKKLSFILDTGVNKTIIFNLSKNDSIGLLDTEKIVLRGLGDGEPVAAILSKGNTLKIDNLINYNEPIFVILKDFFDLSSRMGITIHGIIGYNLLRNFVLKINYRTKKIVFYNSKNYKIKKCRKCEVLPIQFYRKKPFINLKVQLDTIGNTLTDVKMLIDSGGSDSLWLFEDSKEEIKTPIRYFNDILGEGLSGAIYGNRSRIPKLKIGDFEIENPTVSFLDSLATQNARSLKQRNGSIGGNILKRFKVWIDYRNQKIMLKKNGSFKSGFNYNMSGLDVVYNGKQLVQEEDKTLLDGYKNQLNDASKISFVTSYSYKFKPSYKIKSVIENSPGGKAGLLPGDIIIKINGNMANNLKLSEINAKFQQKNNKRIKLLIERNGKTENFQFRLEKKI